MIFFYLIFLLCLNISSAKDHFYSNSTRDWGKVYRRSRKSQSPRATSEYTKEIYSCDQLWRTARHPFVVIMLYKTSGRFVGMGSIVDRRIVLTARRITEKVMNNPRDLLALAGRMIPWWGRFSQVRHARKIRVNRLGLALVEVDHDFIYNANVLPVTIAKKSSGTGSSWGIFGIPRSIWDRPADPLDKLISYFMEVDDAASDQAECFKTFPDMFINGSLMFCSNVKAAYSWGCLGSPSIIFQDGKTVQVGIIVGTSSTDSDVYHLHVKVGAFEFWIKSFTVFGIPTIG